MSDTTVQPTPPGQAAIRLQDAAPPPRAPKPKLKKLRLALVVLGLGFIALISTVFGMMMAVGSDLPDLENRAEFKRAQNSVMRAADGSKIAKLTGNNNRILVKESQINPNIKNAVIAIEDKRFYEHRGVDYQGIARALGQDVLQQRAAQGASTITQQFVKNATEAQSKRTVLEKLREAALAYHLERRWSKQKILTQYLNTVYFGNGAYGIESAVRTYFPHGGTTEGKPVLAPGQVAPPTEEADDGYDPNERAAENVTPAQAAMIAGVIASPSAYDPAQHPKAALDRRNQVLKNMLDQKAITQSQYDEAIHTVLPTKSDIRPPQPVSDQPYWSTWVTQQLVDRYRPQKVFSGGLDVKTTIDPKLQTDAMNAINGQLAGVGPSASLVAIENKTGKVKAMVGGTNFKRRPFNLATNGHRQPGSSIKPFTLIEALKQGIGPGATFTSQKKEFNVPGTKGKEKFVVNNYEGSYSGSSDIANALVRSDNSVYAELGLKVGTKKISKLMKRMGIATKVSDNPAMTLGGLKEGVTPLEMAYAYSTIANDGKRVTGTWGSRGKGKGGPVAIDEVKQGKEVLDKDKVKSTQVLPPGVAQTAKGIMHNVVTSGTGKEAQIGEFAAGKTGTTENYGDAWFVGFNKDLTVAVWVGYADKLKPMKTEYHGSEVAGGTFPAAIWHDFMEQFIQLRDDRESRRKAQQCEREKAKQEKSGDTTTGVDGATVPDACADTGPTETTPYDGPAVQSGTGGGDTGGGEAYQGDGTGDTGGGNDGADTGGGGNDDGGGGGGGGNQQPTPKPEPTPAPAPAPTPAPTPGTGGGGATPGAGQ